MGQSLKARFNGNSQEVVDYARTWGIYKAMEHYGVKDFVAFKTFIEEVNGAPLPTATIGLLSDISGRNWAEQLLDAFTNKLHQMEVENQNLHAQLERLQIELDYYKANQAKLIEPKIQKILNICKA